MQESLFHWEIVPALTRDRELAYAWYYPDFSTHLTVKTLLELNTAYMQYNVFVTNLLTVKT